MNITLLFALLMTRAWNVITPPYVMTSVYSGSFVSSLCANPAHVSASDEKVCL